MDNDEARSIHREEEILVSLLERILDKWMAVNYIDGLTEPFCSKVAKDGKPVLYLKIEERFFRIQLERRLNGEEEWKKDSTREKDFNHMRDHNVAEEAEQIIRNLGT